MSDQEIEGDDYSGMHFEVETHAFMEEDLRLIAEELRYEQTDKDSVTVAFYNVGWYTRAQGIARAVAIAPTSLERAEKRWSHLSDEEFDWIIHEGRAVEVDTWN